MSEKKQYLIDKTTLWHLLVDNFKYETLCLYGEDDYKQGERFEMAKAMCNLPWNCGRSIDDMIKVINEEDYDVGVLVEDQINAFWEEHHSSGKWITKERIINEYGDTESSFICSCCNKKYKCGEYTPKRFIEEHKFCPNCGAKMDGGMEEE